MKIGELALVAQCTVETVRYYEKAGLLPEPARTPGNFRVYGPEHLERLRFIRNCRALDMSQEEIHTLLNLADQPADGLLAWVVFREQTDRRIVFGMLLIVLGGAVLAWSGSEAVTSVIGPLALVGACMAWAIDNNLTRKVSASDALFIAGSKGLVAGCVNIVLG
eukprot:gene19117-18994_t